MAVTAGGMKRRFERLQTDEVILNSMKETEGDIRDLNLEQMYDGLTKHAEQIRPSYLEDPYWDTHGFGGEPPGLGAAEAYADWKQRITPNPRRQKYTPNLYINGFFHRSIRVKVAGSTIKWSSQFDDQEGISDKFDNIYGLGGTYRNIYLFQYFTPVFKDKIFRAVGLLMK